MKQCEPLKEPLHVSEECAPCPPGLRNRRWVPMGHVGIVASDPDYDFTPIEDEIEKIYGNKRKC